MQISPDYERSSRALKLAGCLMLLSGWIIVLVALVLLPGLGLRGTFVVAGLTVEIVGLGLLGRGQVEMERRKQAVARSISNPAGGLGPAVGFRAGDRGFGGLR